MNLHSLNESRITVFWMVVCCAILLATIGGCLAMVLDAYAP